VANLRSRFPRGGWSGLNRRDRATNERWSSSRDGLILAVQRCITTEDDARQLEPSWQASRRWPGPGR
jgi:hypothetical protein